MGSGAGRNKILFFTGNILPPGPASTHKPPPCHPEPPDGGSGKVKGGEGSASIGKYQNIICSSNKNFRINFMHIFYIGSKEPQSGPTAGGFIEERAPKTFRRCLKYRGIPRSGKK